MENIHLYTIDDIKRTYESIQNHVRTKRIILNYSQNTGDIREVALEGLDLSRVRNVLDMGCGYGFFTESLKGLLKEETHIVGMDVIDHKNRESFLTTVTNMGYKGDFIAENANRIKTMEDSSFDLVIASYSLYFFPHLIGEIARILAEDGIFIAVTHTESSLKEAIQIIPVCMEGLGMMPPDEILISKLFKAFSMENGKARLDPYFGEIEKIVFENSLTFPLENVDDCIEYLDKKKHLLFKDILDNYPDKMDALILSFNSSIHESAQRGKEIALTKDDVVFRCYKPRDLKTVNGFRKRRLFCCYCGNPLTQSQIEGKLRDNCLHCHAVFYENPLPVASCIVVNEAREILLVKRKKEPYSGMWCLPIGFAETGEEIRDAALRELSEETGLNGTITRLIDVDTIDNYFYGSMAIITYEAAITGGALRPGDDACDGGYFPLSNLPPLAWSSNRKALDIYIELNRDTWAMVDSFKQLFPDIDTMKSFAPRAEEQKKFLSNILMKMIGRDMEEISRNWAEDVQSVAPHLTPYLETLSNMNRNVLKGVQSWLQGQSQAINLDVFMETGTTLSNLDVPLADVLNAMALSRKSIWTHVVKKRILSSPLEIYATLELNNRIIFLYDKINYYLTAGYFKK
ncbi:MAG: NUDIX domain-containing protein [Syntrophobacterales bacterium]|nr:MAG: NUDIX domain-containing protein [Syntrophobacterales bacterium]